MLRHTFALACALMAVPAAAQHHIALNGGAEELVGGKLAHWGRYGGSGSVEIGQADGGHQGRCAYLKALRFTTYSDETHNKGDYINVGLVQGDANGYTGPNAYPVIQPPHARFFKRGMAARYQVSWFMRGDAGPVNVLLRGWTTDEAKSNDRTAAGLLPKTMPHAEWTRYEATASLPQGTKRFCVMFQIYGFKSDGVKLGRLYVDDVRIEPRAPLGPDDLLKRVVIPRRPRVFIGNAPIEELAAAYAAGDGRAKARVDGIVKAAQRYDRLTDEKLRGLVAEFEPRGNYSACCPIHPFLVRYYNDFKWSFADPWHVVCPQCKKEGRKIFKYPNPRYPDDGNGCAPTDEVWRADHDARWTRGHRGIAWERWDGVCHGYIEAPRFYFKGKAYCTIIQRLSRRVLPRVGEAYQVCTNVLTKDDPRRALAAKFAHQGKAIMFLLCRAHLGDDYLAAANGMSPDAFRRLVCGFFKADRGPWRYRPYPGFRPFAYTWDATPGDSAWAKWSKKRAHTSSLTYYFGAWNMRESIADGWVSGACLLRDSYTPKQGEAGLPGLAMRMLVSQEGDRERLAQSDYADPYLKRGLLEYEVHPYNLESGADNLFVSSLAPRLKLGLMLHDDEIIEKIAQDITYFWSNMASGDGMGWEGSPTYAGGTWAPGSIAEKLQGFKGEFNAAAPYYDAKLGGLNLLGMKSYRRCLGLMDAMMPDGLYISFEDSCHGGGYGASWAQRLERYGAGIPEPYRSCFDIRHKGDVVSVTRKAEFTLPSRLLHDNRKAILRIGEGRKQMLAALDYSMIVGHYHEAPLSLMVYAKGHELVSDLGYMGSCHHLTTKWIRTFASHNSLILRTADGNPAITRPLRGDLELYDAGGPVQMVEAAERDAADLHDGPGEDSGVYRRTIALVGCGEDGYVVDVCRARGGAMHDYQFHSHGRMFKCDLPLKPLADAGQTLYDYSSFLFKTSGKYGVKNVERLRVAKSAGPFTATWSDVASYRRGHKGPTDIDRDAALRLWMLDRAGSEIIVGQAPGQRFLHNEDFGRRITQLRVRRRNTDAVDEFAAVVEPYSGKPFIRSVERLPARTGVVALKVVTDLGTDYVVSSLDEKPVGLRDGRTVVRTAGRFAAARVGANGQALSLLVVRGTRARVGESAVESAGPACLTGKVEGMLPDEFALLVRAEPPLPAGDVLAGQTLIVQHTRGRSSFTIARVGAPVDAVQKVQFADMPKLLANVLLVVDVKPDRLVVEPPPVLVRSPVDSRVYHRTQQGLRPLGKLGGIGSVNVFDERGRRLYNFRTLRVPTTAGVTRGDEVAVSRIVPGRDTFEIPLRLSMHRQAEK